MAAPIDVGLLALAATTCLVWAAFAIDAYRGRTAMSYVREMPLIEGVALAALPRVSVIVPARNEALYVESALGSILALEYLDLEVIAVDDRSDDATGEVLDKMAASDRRLKVIHIAELPGGWIGKNHALQRGADVASGELLLFTDADVVFERTLLARAVAFLLARRFDHLTMPADVRVASPALELFVATFAVLFNGYFRPWRVGDPRSSAAVGFGTFNLVRRAAYERAGGHAALAMDPLDDVRLAVNLKGSGAVPHCAVAGSFLSVEWYPSLAAAFRGLEKNTLGAVNYSVPLLVAGGLAQMVMLVWPFVAVLVTAGATQWLNVATVGTIAALQIGMLRETSLRLWTVPLLPLGVLLVQTCFARAAVLALWRGGIYWRGTFYRLDDLRGS